MGLTAQPLRGDALVQESREAASACHHQEESPVRHAVSVQVVLVDREPSCAGLGAVAVERGASDRAFLLVETCGREVLGDSRARRRQASAGIATGGPINAGSTTVHIRGPRKAMPNKALQLTNRRAPCAAADQDPRAGLQLNA